DFSLSRLTSLPPEQKGFFFVRSDGRERRYLGPASRDPSFRVGQGPIAALLSQGNVFTLSPPIPFSPNGRRIALTDLGPGPAGSSPEHNVAAFTVRIDGSKLQPVPTPVAQPGSHVVPTFGVTGRRTNLVRLAVPGTPVNHVPDPRVVFPISEVFLQDGKNLP